MRYRYAAKLHNADEVISRRTKRVCRVISVTTTRSLKEVRIAVIDPVEGWMVLTHKEIK